MLRKWRPWILSVLAVVILLLLIFWPREHDRQTESVGKSVETQKIKSEDRGGDDGESEQGATRVYNLERVAIAKGKDVALSVVTLYVKDIERQSIQVSHFVGRLQPIRIENNKGTNYVIIENDFPRRIWLTLYSECMIMGYCEK